MAAGNGEVFVIVSTAFTGRVKFPLTLSFEESVTVTLNETVVTPLGGVPDRKPAAVKLSQEGRPVADQVYPPLPPEAVKLSE